MSYIKSSTLYQKRFMLIDCDHFFVSCERLFNPQLHKKPVVVLSSNDACIIARSPEAKKLGIGMGQPYWECKHLLERYKVHVFSSNYTLYADISARVMNTIMHYVPDCEIYSIDEAFITLMLPFSATPAYFTNFAIFLKHTIYRHVGIPVTIGIGPTKTLAKIAHTLAKKNGSGVFDISDCDHDYYLAQIPVEDIWGIGYRYSKKLITLKILTAKDFKYQDPVWIKKQMTITGLRTHQELWAMVALSLLLHPESRKSITVSQLFGKVITTQEELYEAVAAYMARAVEKLQRQKSCAQDITLFVVYQHHQDPERHAIFAHFSLGVPTAYTPQLTHAAYQCLNKLYKPGRIYRKVGIILNGLVAQHEKQLALTSSLPDKRHEWIMNTIHQAHTKWGRDTLFFAAAGIKRPWRMKQLMRSRHYTTNWLELLEV